MKQKTLCSCQICKSGKCGICRDALYNNTEGMKVLDHKLIQSEQDIMKLNIIDWKRHDPWPDPQAAMHTIFSWFNKNAHYTILEENLETAPDRDDFPGWHHTGDHEGFGRLYWNWFQHWHGSHGELHFSDSPDFYGKFHNPDGAKWFWGDVGQCSAQALARSQKQMNAGDLWISLTSINIQVVIETSVDLINLFEQMLYKEYQQRPTKAVAETLNKHVQLSLFD